MQNVIVTKSSEETADLGKQVAEKVRDGGVVCLYGDLGSGKTTFTQGLARALGVTKQVNSPTFLIMKSYEVPIKHEEARRDVYHIDLYRLGSEKEMEDIGLSEILSDPKNIVIIEWSEKLGSLQPKRRIDIHFAYVDEEVRRLNIHDYR